MDDHGGITVGLGINPHIATRIQRGLLHVHKDGERARMVEVDSKDADAGYTIHECSCGSRTVLYLNVENDLEGMERFPALTAVVNTASGGHVPPDHVYAVPVDVDCPLCVALQNLTNPLPGEP